MNIFKSFCFSLAKKGAAADPKKSAPAPAPAQILNRLRLQPKNLGSDRLCLRNTASFPRPPNSGSVLSYRVTVFQIFY